MKDTDRENKSIQVYSIHSLWPKKQKRCISKGNLTHRPLMLKQVSIFSYFRKIIKKVVHKIQKMKYFHILKDHTLYSVTNRTAEKKNYNQISGHLSHNIPNMHHSFFYKIMKIINIHYNIAHFYKSWKVTHCCHNA